MKVPVILVFLLWTVHGDVQPDLLALLEDFPFVMIVDPFLQEWARDPEVQESVKSTYSEKFHQQVLQFEAQPWFGAVLRLLARQGLDVGWFVEGLHELFHMSPGGFVTTTPGQQELERASPPA